MALFKGHVENTQHLNQESAPEQLPKQPSMIESVKHYFHDQFLQWKAFGANQIDDSEIVQTYKKMTAPAEVYDNVINFDAATVAAAKASLEEKKSEKIVENEIKPSIKTYKKAKLFAIPETAEQKQKRLAEEAEEKEYAEIMEEFEKMIMDPNLSILDTPAAIGEFLNNDMSYFMKDVAGNVLRHDFFVLSVLYPDAAIVKVPDFFTAPQIEEPKPSRWSKMKSKIPFLRKAETEDADKVTSIRELAQKRYEKEQQKAASVLKDSDNTARNKWRIVETISNKLGKNVTTRLLQKMVNKHIGKLSVTKISS